MKNYWLQPQKILREEIEYQLGYKLESSIDDFIKKYCQRLDVELGKGSWIYFYLEGNYNHTLVFNATLEIPEGYCISFDNIRIDMDDYIYIEQNTNV